MYLRCLKKFLLNNYYRKGYVLYFESIHSFLKHQNMVINPLIFIFEDILNLNEFIHLCFLYGSQYVKIVTTHQRIDSKNFVNRKYKIKDFIIDVKYNEVDCFIETYASIKHNGRCKTLKLNDICYIESFYGRIYFHTLHSCYEGKFVSIYKYEAILKDLGFIKIRKGCYVNKIHIKDIKANMIILDNNLSFFFSKNICYKNIQLY